MSQSTKSIKKSLHHSIYSLVRDPSTYSYKYENTYTKDTENSFALSVLKNKRKYKKKLKISIDNFFQKCLKSKIKQNKDIFITVNDNTLNDIKKDLNFDINKYILNNKKYFHYKTLLNERRGYKEELSDFIPAIKKYNKVKYLYGFLKDNYITTKEDIDDKYNTAVMNVESTNKNIQLFIDLNKTNDAYIAKLRANILTQKDNRDYLVYLKNRIHKDIININNQIEFYRKKLDFYKDFKLLFMSIKNKTIYTKELNPINDNIIRNTTIKNNKDYKRSSSKNLIAKQLYRRIHTFKNYNNNISTPGNIPISQRNQKKNTIKFKIDVNNYNIYNNKTEEYSSVKEDIKGLFKSPEELINLLNKYEEKNLHLLYIKNNIDSQNKKLLQQLRSLENTYKENIFEQKENTYIEEKNELIIYNNNFKNTLNKLIRNQVNEISLLKCRTIIYKISSNLPINIETVLKVKNFYSTISNKNQQYSYNTISLCILTLQNLIDFLIKDINSFKNSNENNNQKYNNIYKKVINERKQITLKAAELHNKEVKNLYIMNLIKKVNRIKLRQYNKVYIPYYIKHLITNNK